MRYVVTFRKRFNYDGEPADDPRALVDFDDGVVTDAEFVQIIEPPSLHVTEDISGRPTSQSAEDDGWLGFGSETWVYDVAEGRDEDFKRALANSEVVLEIQDFDDDLIQKPFTGQT
jgi:hypothetical protein